MNQAIASIYHDLFMYYFTKCIESATLDFLDNMGGMFIDHQHHCNLDFDRQFICAEQNPETYDALYGLNAHLKQFYLEMYHWITHKECKYQFSPTIGLCCNLRKYMYSNDIKHGKRASLLNMLESQFISAGLDENFPFNNGNRGQYDNEHLKYENQHRIDWIKKHATSVQPL